MTQINEDDRQMNDVLAWRDMRAAQAREKPQEHADDTVPEHLTNVILRAVQENVDKHAPGQGRVRIARKNTIVLNLTDDMGERFYKITVEAI